MPVFSKASGLGPKDMHIFPTTFRSLLVNHYDRLDHFRPGDKALQIRQIDLGLLPRRLL